MSREYIAIYSDGTGGLWFLIRASSRTEIEQKYPMLEVFEVHEAPAGKAMDLERLRVFVAPGTDPLDPVRLRSAHEQEKFLEYREQVLQEVRENDARSPLPPEVARRINSVPRWFDIGDDAFVAEYLESLPPPYSR